MTIFERAKNIWELSQYRPGQPTEETKTPGTEVAMIVKAPPKQTGRFIPFERKDPIKELIEEQP